MHVDEPAAPFGDGGLVRVRLDLAYDGTAFAGWARQRDQRTVQAVVEDALGVVLRLTSPPSLTVAGRTDAGVHAAGQVAHVDLPELLEETDRVARRLAAVLPPDVRVRDVSVAPPEFDARFSALARTYAYRVADHLGVQDPLRRNDTLWWPRRLDADALNRASAGLLGTHDFAAFCRRREGATTIRALQRLDWERGPDGVLVATVVADAFCHSMVRSLVGALLAVGEGRRPESWPAELLAEDARASSVTVAPPHGLTLLHVDYPPAAELAARAEVTRRVRTPSEAQG